MALRMPYDVTQAGGVNPCSKRRPSVSGDFARICFRARFDLLDERYPTRRMFPQRPMGGFVQVVEEYFDEWIPRVVLHFLCQLDAAFLLDFHRSVEGQPGFWLADVVGNQ